MKTNFIDQYFRDPISGSVGAAASAAFPPLAAVQAGAGTLQSILGYFQAHKAQKGLEKLQTPTYTPAKSILDYYNESLKRYNVQPTETSLYKRSQNSILRNQGAGLNALRERRLASSDINKLIAGSNDASLNADVAAENQRNLRFGELGKATGMEAGEEGKAFQYNKLLPYQKQYALLAAKAGGGNQILNAGLSNIFGGLNTANQYNMLDKIYNQG